MATTYSFISISFNEALSSFTISISYHDLIIFDNNVIVNVFLKKFTFPRKVGNTMQFGQKIKALRNLKHLTQDQIAEALGVKRARYNAWENGISNPDHLMLISIAKYHNVTVDFLLGLSQLRETTLSYDNLHSDSYTDEDILEDLAKNIQNKNSLKVEGDIATDLEQLIYHLKSNKDLTFYGNPMNDETKELMRISLENSLFLTKVISKLQINSNKDK